MSTVTTYFVSGHLDLTQEEFALHYAHLLDAARAAGGRFVVGDARGADAMAQAYLAGHGAPCTVFHCFESPRHNVGGWPVRGGYRSDDARDAALTSASDVDIAWVRPGRARSGTARNLSRRGGTVEVARASVADWPRLRSLRLTALMDAPDAFGGTFAAESLREEAQWQERLARPEVYNLFAQIASRDVGLCAVAPTETPEVAGLYSVWVSAAARGRGAGDALVREALRVARARGYRQMVLDVGDANAHAIALYTRCGFAPTGRRGTLPEPRTHVTEREMAIALDL